MNKLMFYFKIVDKILRHCHLGWHDSKPVHDKTSERKTSDQAVCPSNQIKEIVERMKSVSHR